MFVLEKNVSYLRRQSCFNVSLFVYTKKNQLCPLLDISNLVCSYFF